MSTQRYLNRIVFIKSAEIDYQEILLDGNIHFTGDQGVGKSTVLRAILFFYTADSQRHRLDIPRESNQWKDFDEHYFQYANSHIVYEVNAGYAKFLVWLYKEMNKLCYRFINAPFKQEFFLEQSVKGKGSLSPDKVLEMVRAETDCSRKIDHFSEYRDVLYGSRTNDKAFKPLRQYALMESSAYHNIPRTINNVFLNAKLLSDAIKTTIIDSMSGDDFQAGEGNGYRIDLQVLRKQINDFKNDYDDIADFGRSQKRAEYIIRLYTELQQLEEDKIQTARCLGASVQAAHKKREELATTLRTNETKRQERETQLLQFGQQHKAETEKFKEEIISQKKDIAKANEKIAYYQGIGIEQMLQRVNQENTLRLECTEAIKQKRALETEFESIEQKYQVVLDRLANEQAGLDNSIEQQINTLRSTLLLKQQKLMDEYQKLFEELDEKRDKRVEESERQRNALQDGLANLKGIEQKILQTPYFKQEIERINAELQALNQSIPQKESEIKLKQANITNFENQAKSERDHAQIIFEQQRQDILRQQQATRLQLEEIVTKLQSFENSFYDFLNHNYSGWEETIGKVCDESILFENALSPVIEQVNELFYGIKLDLHDVEKKVKTLADYEQEQSRLKEELDQFDHVLSELVQQEEINQQDLIKKFNSKIKPLQRDIRSLQVEVQQIPSRIKRLEVDLEEYDKKVKLKQAEDSEKITLQIIETGSKLQGVIEQLTDLKKHYKQEKKHKTQEQGEKLKELEQEFQLEEQHFKRQQQEMKQQYGIRKQQCEAQKYAELQGKGIDTSQIQRLEQRIADISKELQEIERLKKQYINKYDHDREEYIERLQEFENRKTSLEIELRDVDNQWKTEQRNLDATLKQLYVLLEKLRGQEKELRDHLQCFEEFKIHELYRELENQILDFGTMQSEETVTTLIGRLKDLALQLKTKNEEFRETITNFVSPLREENIFKFPKQFADNAAYHAFAQNVKEYIEENKIERAKQDVKKMHADLIRLIVTDIENLMSKRKEIDETISRMNKDFDRSNFVGVVQKVGLRTDDSKNKIVQTLQEIQKFHAENPFNFGELNLFTGIKLEEHNEKAIKLLTALLDNLKKEPRTEITLEDTFELKFRVIQNQKDTGWQEKLTAIGSGGTDILVKAMIYIMLLNVFKEKASKKFKDFTLHCLMDEIGKIHPKNIKHLIEFANQRGIWMINGSPVEDNAPAYRHIYDFTKNEHSITRVARLITQH